MDYPEWERFYNRILEDFEFSREADERVAAELDRILGGTRIDVDVLRDLLEGQEVTVAGNGPNLAKEIDAARGILLTADESTSVVVSRGLRPAVLVTDLDGDVEDQIRVNAEGAIAVIHGHGDNGPAVRKWAPQFTGKTIATTQSKPSGRLENFGGFTDGDRAVFLADHCGAATIHLVGFDFENPSPKDVDAEQKKRKLDWAYILLGSLNRPDLDL